MAQFDIYRTAYPAAPFVLDIQSDLLRHLKTRVVIPLERASDNLDPPVSRLHPVISVKGEVVILNTAEMSTLNVNELGTPVESLADTHRQMIIEAVDFLVHGY